MTGLRWIAGDAGTRRAVERWLAGELAGQVLADSPRRRLLRLEPGGGGPLLLKHFRVTSAGAPGRQRLKARLGAAPAEREWRVLGALRRAGAPVPEPLGLAHLPDGDRLVVMRFAPGRPLRAVLGGGRAERRRALVAVGRAVARLHAAGFAHRDLHHGNVLVDGGVAWLLDLQRARRSARRGARLRDLGWLDYSVAASLSAPDRLRLRAAALGLERPFDAEARRALRAVGRASARRARAHARSRTRRCLRPGRLYARLEAAGAAGLRLRRVDAEALEALLAAHRAALAAGDPRVLKDDGRSRITRVAARGLRAVVKETPRRGALRPLVDLARGSAGRRAWRGGHGLLARGIGAAVPLAFLERRRLGLPVASLVVLEDLHPDPSADAAAAPDFEPPAVAEALGSLALALHRRAVHHGDLKASHVQLRRGAAGIETRLIDLEGVRFPRALSDARRLQALVELNASLPDRVPAEARCRAFARYAGLLPFAAGRERALARLVERSLARRHRWTGRGCALAEQPAARRRRAPST